MGRKRPHRGRRRPSGHQGRRGQGPLLQGVIRIVRPGSATVETPEGTFPVARGGIHEAMSGDEVQVSLVHRGGTEKQAVVRNVVRRTTHSFVGTFGVADPLGVISPLDGRLHHDFFVIPTDDSPRRLGVGEGDVVRARILEYPTRKSAGVATIDERLGTATELDLDIEAVIASVDLATDFPQAVLDQAAAIEVGVDQALERDERRRDLRGLCTLTIDPTDARDFDDAVSARRLEDGGFELGVHIADVTHYVGWNTSIDNEAKQRTCSVYLVDRVLPMLPERLCNDVCSLVAGKDRLTMSVILQLDRRGVPRDAEVMTAAICSHARLDYDTADRLLAGEIEPDDLPCSPDDAQEVAETIRILDEVARLRTERRRERGAVDFDTREAKVLLDDKGHPTGVSVRQKTPATSLIEEAMLLANESVAKVLADRDIAVAYRVHERPSPDDLKATLPVLRELGLVAGDLADRLVAGEPAALHEVLDAAKGTAAERLVSTLLLRAQKRALYQPHNEGHYALGARAYCHFTSPIRRYPDDVVHRALKALLAGDVESREQRAVAAALPQLCRTCSDLERVADAAGRTSQKVKMAELMGEHLGESFSGVVVGCERFGLFVELDETCAEGLLPTRALGEEWFTYDEDHLRLVGESTGRIWRVGQRVAVRVAEVKVPRGQIDFELAGRS